MSEEGNSVFKKVSQLGFNVKPTPQHFLQPLVLCSQHLQRDHGSGVASNPSYIAVSSAPRTATSPNGSPGEAAPAAGSTAMGSRNHPGQLASSGTAMNSSKTLRVSSPPTGLLPPLSPSRLASRSNSAPSPYLDISSAINGINISNGFAAQPQHQCLRTPGSPSHLSPLHPSRCSQHVTVQTAEGSSWQLPDGTALASPAAAWFQARETAGSPAVSSPSSPSQMQQQGHRCLRDDISISNHVTCKDAALARARRQRKDWDSSTNPPAEPSFEQALRAWQQALEQGAYGPKFLGSWSAVSSGHISAATAAAHSTPNTASAMAWDGVAVSPKVAAMPAVFQGSGDEAVQALEQLVFQKLVAKPHLTLLQLQRGVQAVSALEIQYQLAAIGVMLGAGCWMAAMQVAYTDLSVLAEVLVEMRAIIETGLQWDDQLAAATWHWSAIDRDLFMRSFRGLGLISQHQQLRKQLSRFTCSDSSSSSTRQAAGQLTALGTAAAACSTAANVGSPGPAASSNGRVNSCHPDLARAERMLLLSVIDNYLAGVDDALAVQAAATAEAAQLDQLKLSVLQAVDEQYACGVAGVDASTTASSSETMHGGSEAAYVATLQVGSDWRVLASTAGEDTAEQQQQQTAIADAAVADTQVIDMVQQGSTASSASAEHSPNSVRARGNSRKAQQLKPASPARQPAAADAFAITAVPADIVVTAVGNDTKLSGDLSCNSKHSHSTSGSVVASNAKGRKQQSGRHSAAVTGALAAPKVATGAAGQPGLPFDSSVSTADVLAMQQPNKREEEMPLALEPQQPQRHSVAQEPQQQQRQQQQQQQQQAEVHPSQQQEPAMQGDVNVRQQVAEQLLHSTIQGQMGQHVAQAETGHQATELIEAPASAGAGEAAAVSGYADPPQQAAATVEVDTAEPAKAAERVVLPPQPADQSQQAEPLPVEQAAVGEHAEPVQHVDAGKQATQANQAAAIEQAQPPELAHSEDLAAATAAEQAGPAEPATSAEQVTAAVQQLEPVQQVTAAAEQGGPTEAASLAEQAPAFEPAVPAEQVHQRDSTTVEAVTSSADDGSQQQHWQPCEEQLAEKGGEDQLEDAAAQGQEVQGHQQQQQPPQIQECQLMQQQADRQAQQQQHSQLELQEPAMQQASATTQVQLPGDVQQPQQLLSQQQRKQQQETLPDADGCQQQQDLREDSMQQQMGMQQQQQEAATVPQQVHIATQSAAPDLSTREARSTSEIYDVAEEATDAMLDVLSGLSNIAKEMSSKSVGFRSNRVTRATSDSVPQFGLRNTRTTRATMESVPQVSQCKDAPRVAAAGRSSKVDTVDAMPQQQQQQQQQQQPQVPSQPCSRPQSHQTSRRSTNQSRPGSAQVYHLTTTNASDNLGLPGMTSSSRPTSAAASSAAAGLGSNWSRPQSAAGAGVHTALSGSRPGSAAAAVLARSTGSRPPSASSSDAAEAGLQRLRDSCAEQRRNMELIAQSMVAGDSSAATAVAASYQPDVAFISPRGSISPRPWSPGKSNLGSRPQSAQRSSNIGAAGLTGVDTQPYSSAAAQPEHGFPLGSPRLGQLQRVPEEDSKLRLAYERSQDQSLDAPHSAAAGREDAYAGETSAAAAAADQLQQPGGSRVQSAQEQLPEELQRTMQLFQQRLEQTALMAQQLLAQQVAGQAACNNRRTSNSRPTSAGAAAGSSSSSSRPSSASVRTAGLSGHLQGGVPALALDSQGGDVTGFTLTPRKLAALDVEEAPHAEEVAEYARYLGMDPEQDADLLYIAELAMTAPCPDGWTIHLDKHGNEFFYNTTSQASTYEHPMDEHYRQLYQQKRQERREQLLGGLQA